MILEDLHKNIPYFVWDVLGGKGERKTFYSRVQNMPTIPMVKQSAVYAFENLNPYQFLKAKYKGAEPTDRDKKLIENLLVELKLNPGVVNVLISYVLKINNEQLTKNYVETIAGQLKRLNVETVEDAMGVLQKEHSKMKKKTDKVKVTKTKDSSSKTTTEPEWFNKSVDILETTSEDVEELDNILKGII